MQHLFHFNENEFWGIFSLCFFFASAFSFSFCCKSGWQIVHKECTVNFFNWRPFSSSLTWPQSVLCLLWIEKGLVIGGGNLKLYLSQRFSGISVTSPHLSCCAVYPLGGWDIVQWNLRSGSHSLERLQKLQKVGFLLFRWERSRIFTFTFSILKKYLKHGCWQ